MRVATGVGLAAVSGVLVLLAAPQHGFGWLIVVAGVPVSLAVSSKELGAGVGGAVVTVLVLRDLHRSTRLRREPS